MRPGIFIRGTDRPAPHTQRPETFGALGEPGRAESLRKLLDAHQEPVPVTERTWNWIHLLLGLEREA